MDPSRARVRPDVLTHFAPHQFCNLSRDTRSEYTVERAVRLSWHEILGWHGQNNTQAYQSVLAAADFTETEDKAIAQLERRLGRRLPVDLAYSWKIQGRRCYLSDYQYIDAGRVLDCVFPDTEIEGFTWSRGNRALPTGRLRAAKHRYHTEPSARYALKNVSRYDR